jgi:3-polyprenyl-4-hydroxybenzoate decarboxylase
MASTGDAPGIWSRALPNGQNPGMARVLVGVTGGIAAYKACELVRLLVKAGHEVIPLVTSGAERFVRADTFFALARRSPAEDLYAHLTRADLLVVAPLTANTLAKLAGGLADNLATEAALAHRGPVLLAPAMNPRMWAHPATQTNLETVRSRGAEIVGPDEGELAEGEWGVGRMAEPEEIFRRCRELLGESDSLAGRRVLVTAGGTREPFDAVRFLGNRSSGRMGVALAEEARKRGADVTLLAANLAVPAPSGIEVVETPTAESMLEAALARADADVVLMAAAVRREAAQGRKGLAGEPRADGRHPASARGAADEWPGADRFCRRPRGARSLARARETETKGRRSRRLQRCLTRRRWLRLAGQRGRARQRRRRSTGGEGTQRPDRGRDRRHRRGVVV